MKSKALKKLTLSLISLTLAAVLLIGVVFAWVFVGDDVGEFRFRIARINSKITFYSANDSNYNGIPDMITNEATGLLDYDFGDPTYAVYAHTTGEEDNDAYVDIGAMSDAMIIDDFLPTQRRVFKVNILNESEANNLVRFNFESYEGIENLEDTLTAMSALSVCVGYDRDDDGDIDHDEFSEKAYFADHVEDGNLTDFDIVNNIVILGIIYATEDLAGKNRMDFWLRFEFETYDALSSRAEEMSYTALTSEEYAPLSAGTSIALPTLRIYLEVDDEIIM